MFDRSRWLGARVLWACALVFLVPAGLQAQHPEKAPEFKGLVPHRVYQRDARDLASIPIQPADDDVKVTGVRLFLGTADGGLAHVRGPSFSDGALRGVLVGGPYKVQVEYTKGSGNFSSNQTTIGPIFVGDLWVLAGQSNMEGVADLLDVTQPDDRVMLLGMNGQWERAEEPLHWLVDSPDPVHSGDPNTREERSKQQHKTRTKGAGLGLPFAVAMVEATDVPVGLVACAHGGTSMEQWNPDKKDEGGKSLYGSMMRQFDLAGGKVKGVLWYQGESDANDKASAVYPKVFADFIATVRKDFKQPELPFYYVQIGRFIRAGDPKPWNAVQEAERTLVDKVPNTAVVSVIDLELDDLIHVGVQGQKRVGQRLANIALHELFGHAVGTTPTFERVTRGPGNTLVVRFKGVNFDDQDEGLQPATHVAGFSLRKDDGSEIPLIFEARVGRAHDTVVLKLANTVPEGAKLWYGWGFDPYCNLTDSADMAVPVFGPITLDETP